MYAARDIYSLVFLNPCLFMMTVGGNGICVSFILDCILSTATSHERLHLSNGEYKWLVYGAFVLV